MVAERTCLQFKEYMKASRARKPTPEQVRLLEVWKKIGDLLWMYEVGERSPYVLPDSDLELLHINVECDGKVWLTLAEHRRIAVPLEDLCNEGEQLDFIAQAVQQTLSKENTHSP